MLNKKEKLAIVDGNALIHRAFHAIPPLTSKDGLIVNAVYGFFLILFKTLKDIKPTHLVVTFDAKGKTFRHEQYTEYKANRKKQPDELYAQIPMTKEIVEAFGIPVFQISGVEADDVIATIVGQNPDIDKYVVTGDLDALQLVDPNSKVYTMRKGIKDTVIYDQQAVIDRFTFEAEYMVDYKALRGDPSDNIPGVAGVGEKTACQLISKYKTLDNVYKNLDKITPNRAKNALENNKENAYLSYDLAMMKFDVDIDFDLEATQITPYDRKKVVELFQKYNFKNLLAQLTTLDILESDSGQANMFSTAAKTVETDKKKIIKKYDEKYQLIDSLAKFEKFLKVLSLQKEFAFDIETTSLDCLSGELVGISFSFKPGEAYYIALNSFKNKKDQTEILKKLKPILENDKVLKIGQNLKFDLSFLTQAGIDFSSNYFDTMIASYLLNPGSRAHSLDKLAFSEFGYEMMPIVELIGKKGKDQLTIDQVDIDKVSWYACEDADYTYQLYLNFKDELKTKKCQELFTKIEMPLMPVLLEMEQNGVKINSEFLNKKSVGIKKKIKTISAEIYEHAGKEFNIASPKQLKEILFEELYIPVDNIKVGKTGFSTGAAELEKIKDNHPIVPLILQYRELAKIDNTYLESLPKLVSDKDSRVHTSFNQTVTATGRLSSTDPNLQNIPTRTELGKEVRKGFIAETGYEILNADYSQVELRIVASISEDKTMIEAFKKGLDIHTQTAAAINDLDPEEVTKDVRRTAKAVNFGIIYGMGAFGLAQGANITQFEAKDFIDKYLETYKGIKKYMDVTKKFAVTEGYVETLFKRRRYLPEINSGMAQVRRAAERMAINAPIQGTAADIMKIAMIEVSRILKEKFKPTDYKLIIQVHDSLMIETKKEKTKAIAKIVKQVMENVVKLKVPIVVDIEAGKSWGDLKNI